MNKGILLFFLIWIIGTIPAKSAIYKWTDSNGVVHFSDKPHEGSEKVKLPEMQTYSPAVTNKNNEEEDTAEKEDNQAKDYKSIAIAQPSNGATIRNNQGYVPVVISIKPDLKPGDMLQIIYDGEPLGNPQPTTVFALNDVKRGTHTIAVQVVDKEGNILSSSEAVTIYMHRPQVGMVKKANQHTSP